MLRNVSIIGFLILTVVLSANADENERIERIEKEIQQLNARLSKIESMDSTNNSQNTVQEQGRYEARNWRKLVTNMSPADVQKLLGEPDRIDGGSLANWYYQNGGAVIFLNEKVLRWEEPRK